MGMRSFGSDGTDVAGIGPTAGVVGGFLPSGLSAKPGSVTGNNARAAGVKRVYSTGGG